MKKSFIASQLILPTPNSIAHCETNRMARKEKMK